MRLAKEIPKRQRVFLAVYLLVAALMLWPLYGLVVQAEPLLFGLPPSLLWLAACIAILFVALVLLFHADHRTMP